MTKRDERELPRRLAGDEPLARLWKDLEPPPAAPAPPGFATRVMARVREDEARRQTLSRRFGVVPARFAAASALAAGLAAGAGLGAVVPAPAPAPPAAEERAEAVASNGEAVADDPGTLDDSAALDDEAVVAAAVAAATAGGEAEAPPGEASAAPAGPFAGGTGLADGYLAALAAIEEPS
jgi:hypothetical protein